MIGDSRRVELVDGAVIEVDEQDVALIHRYRWRLQAAGSSWYVSRTARTGANRSRGYLHRELLAASAGWIVDHINGNTLDNRRCNLRLCSHAQSARNRGAERGSSSPFKGVSWDRQRGTWVAKIGLDHRRIFLGRFDVAEDAAHAYDSAAAKHFGEFARLNFPIARTARRGEGS